MNDPLSFLQHFGDNFWLQTFDDRKKNKKMAYGYKRNFDELPSFFELAKTLNEKDAGIYFCVNEVNKNARDRKAENIECIRAFFVDLDGADIAPVIECHLQPNIIVQTSPQRWHAYWIMDDFVAADRRVFKELQRTIAIRFRGDESVSDLCRVMRLPGFYNMKKEPFMVTYEIMRLKPCSLKAVQDEFGPKVFSMAHGNANSSNYNSCDWISNNELSLDENKGNVMAAIEDFEFDAARLRGALIAIDPDPYDIWITVGIALQGAAMRTDSELTEDEAYEYWISWSELSNKFDGAMAEQKWQGFEARGEVGLGTVFQMAKESGWNGERRNFWTAHAAQAHLRGERIIL